MWIKPDFAEKDYQQIHSIFKQETHWKEKKQEDIMAVQKIGYDQWKKRKEEGKRLREK